MSGSDATKRTLARPLVPALELVRFRGTTMARRAARFRR